MQQCLAVLLVVLCLHNSLAATVWLGKGGTQSGFCPSRTAHFKRGIVVTKRALAPEADVQGSRRRNQEENREAAFVIGIPAGKQLHVRDTLERDLGGRILAPLGKQPDGEFWLVLGTFSTVEVLLNVIPNTTAAPFPPEFKISAQLAGVIQLLASDDPTGALQNVATSTAADGQVRIMLLALMPALQGQEELTQLISDLEQQAQPLACPVTVEPFVTAKFAQISLCPQDLDCVTTWLSLWPRVTYLELDPAKRTANLHAAAYIQSPQFMRVTPPPDLSKGVKSPYFPLWRAGLDGRDQVIGLVDSGLDMDSCYFWDPVFKDYQQSTSTIPSLNNVTMFSNATHRKVLVYVFYGDGIDGNGHGTHVAATIVGSPYGFSATQQPDLATGIAPGARLAFLDVGAGSDSRLNIPSDPGTLYGFMRRAGARIMSNSWTQSLGETSTDLACSLFDQYTWERQDTLLVFSVGNEGEDPSQVNTTGTAVAPANCKNVLSVGATESWTDKGLEEMKRNLLLANKKQAKVNTEGYIGPWSFGTLYFTYQSNLYVVRSQDVGWTVLQGMDTRFNGLLANLFTLVKADPPNACAPLRKSYRPSDRVVVLVRKSSSLDPCLARVSAQNVADSGATAALIYWEDIEWPRFATSGGLLIGNGTYPVGILEANAGRRLQSILDARITVNLTWYPQPVPKVPPQDNVAIFSSYAAVPNPKATDPRFKPDIVAPGMLLSAKSDGQYTGTMDQCAATASEGTSMSAPVATGAAAIARQYFVDGWYPTGAPVIANQFRPSGALLKAVLIAGAAAMQGVSRANNQPLQPPPSPFQGHGRLDLSKALPLRGDPDAWGMRLVDTASVESSGQSQTYKFNVTRASVRANRTLSVALVWHDYPGFAGSMSLLVNNLDLTVKGPYDNAKEGPPITYWGNGVRGGDLYNNVEKVFIPTPAVGLWYVTIKAKYVYALASPQPYALVSLGAVDTDLKVEPNPPADVTG